ncbi:hypothetical protein ASPCADRAFT_210891 [Aspergillus carbonarius ITEM 5010]|uniref:Uncharacterized protein n=1 Tax=Aspergillus carbonarius (strain ITEM 5010) TaxID=602072 RepID=A0A1R3RAK8_ASPC5|nr:hypothetical protein ASPCADRAFT_210891 [Aspergillus carbonarius ITEM 5010]
MTFGGEDQTSGQTGAVTCGWVLAEQPMFGRPPDEREMHTMNGGGRTDSFGPASERRRVQLIGRVQN